MSNLKQKSRRLTKILRYDPSIIGGKFDNLGYLSIGMVMEKMNLTIEQLTEIVNIHSGGRFEFDNIVEPSKIRALQGHSAEVDTELSIVEINPANPIILMHGTPTKNLQSIIGNKEGIKKGSRMHVHMTTDKEKAKKSASRFKSDYSILYIEFCGYDYEPILYKSKNNVYLSGDIPYEMIVLKK